MSRSKTIEYSPPGRYTVALPRLSIIPDLHERLSPSRTKLLNFLKPKGQVLMHKCKKSLEQINPRNGSQARKTKRSEYCSDMLRIHKLEQAMQAAKLGRKYVPCNRGLEPHPFRKYTDSHATSPIKDRLSTIQDISCNTIQLSKIEYLPSLQNDDIFEKLRNQITIDSENQEEESIGGDLKKVKNELLDISYSLTKEKKRKRLIFKMNRIEKNAPLIKI